MRLPIPGLAGLSDDDRTAVRAALQTSIEKARAQDRLALACVFAVLAEVVGSGSTPPDVLLEKAADLDDDELAAVIAGIEARRERELAGGFPARATLYADLMAGFEMEQQRRAAVLASLDRALAWYETHPLRR